MGCHDNFILSSITLLATVVFAAYGEVLTYQVSVERHNFKICGGGLISDKHVVTAAQCVNSLRIDDIFIVTGINNQQHGSGVRHKVKSITVHPDFKTDNNFHPLDDIAVITIDPPVNTQDFPLKFLSLPSDDITTEVRAEIASWNTPGDDNDIATIAMVHVSIGNQDTCRKSTSISDGQFCIVGGYKGSCNVDIGSPLVYKGEVVGIFSFGEPCGSPEHLDVYTRVYYHKNFILNATKSNSL